MSFKEQSLMGLRKRVQGFSDPSYHQDSHDKQLYDNSNSNQIPAIIEEDNDVSESGG